MGWRFVKQPSGLYARFSEIVDHFTHYGMTRDEAIAFYLEEVAEQAKREAVQKVDAADRWPERWGHDLKLVEEIHGVSAVQEFLTEVEAHEAEVKKGSTK